MINSKAQQTKSTKSGMQFNFQYLRELFKKYKRHLFNLNLVLIMQGLNYVVPMLTIPYQIRTVGLELFGVMSLMLIFMGYFSAIVTYSFNLNAYTELIRNREHPDEAGRIVYRVFFSRLVLFAICLPIILYFSYFIPPYANYRVGLWASTLMLLAILLNTDWIFQAYEAFSMLTISNAIGKLIGIVLLFTLVHDRADYIWAIVATCAMTLVSSILGVIICLRKFKFPVHLPKLGDIGFSLKSGFLLFGASYLVQFFSNGTNLNVFSHYYGTTEIGSFALADKIFLIVASVLGALSLILFPKVGNMKDTKAQLQFVHKIFLGYIAFSTLLAFGLYASSGLIVHFLTGNEDVLSISLLQIQSFALIFAALGAILTPLLVSLGGSNKLFIQNVVMIVINFSLIFPLMSWLGIRGLAYLSIVINFCMPLLLYIMIRFQVRKIETSIATIVNE